MGHLYSHVNSTRSHNKVQTWLSKHNQNVTQKPLSVEALTLLFLFTNESIRMAEREQTQRPSLSFSIDNILRDDFPASYRHNRTVPYSVQRRSWPQLRPVIPCHECLSSRYRPAPVYLVNPQDIKKEAEFSSRTSGKTFPEVVRSSVRCEVGKVSNEQQGTSASKSGYCKGMQY